LFPKELEQETSCCSEYLGTEEGAGLLKMATADSAEAVAEKAQHEPHCPWSWMGETFPWVTQFHEAGRD